MRKKQHEASEEGVNLGLIITPMLDMAFQLMAFFIMTYHPSALEGHIDGTLLPPTELATKGPASTDMTDIPPTDQPPELQDVLMVIVKAVQPGQAEGNRADGEPSRILLKPPELPTPDIVADASDATLDDSMKKLDAALKKVLQNPSNSNAHVKIEADGDVKHQYVVRVYDVCKLAGFKNVAFVAPARSSLTGN